MEERAEYCRLRGVMRNVALVKMEEKDLLNLPTLLIQMAAYEDDKDPHHPRKGEFETGLVGDVDPGFLRRHSHHPRDALHGVFVQQGHVHSTHLLHGIQVGGVIGANAIQGNNVLLD